MRLRLRRWEVIVGLCAGALSVVVLVLALRPDPGPDLGYCEHVLRQAYAAGETLLARPDACAGVSDGDLEAIVAEILSGTDPLTTY